jgi:hypothetical protein
MSSKVKCCCIALIESIDDGTIMYNNIQRLYYLEQKTNVNNWYTVLYCPFCGAKLPTDLCDEHFDAIRDPETGKVLDPLPEEFKSDEWWKKRGL